MVHFGALERVSQINWFCSGRQSAFRDSIGSFRGFRARFAIQLVHFGASKRVSRVNWFSSGLQSAFRQSFDSKLGFKARSVRDSERVLRVNWLSSGLQSAFRDSIGSVWGFRAGFASQLVQFGTSGARIANHLCGEGGVVQRSLQREKDSGDSGK